MKVLIAIDDEKFVDAICNYAVDTLNLQTAEIRIISIVPSLLAYTSLAIVPVVMDDVREQTKKLATDLLFAASKKLADKLPRASITECVIEGLPAEDITAMANHWQADLIVVGSHGKHGLSKILLGSVSQAVVCNPPCSVLVVNLTKALQECEKREKGQLASPAKSHFEAGISLGN